MIGSGTGDGRRGNGRLSVMENVDGNGLVPARRPLGASSRSWEHGWVCLVRPDGILSWASRCRRRGVEAGRGGGEQEEIYQIEIQGDGGLDGG